MIIEAQLAAKIAIAAGQGAINIVSSMKKSKDMRRIVEDIQSISMDICATNKKLDALIEMEQDQVLGRLIAANKKLTTCIAAKSFTSRDIQTIEELYLLNTGLSKNGKTGTYDNNRIIAHSWWGLILLESQTESDIIKLARYMVEMFDADLLMAQEAFPEIYHEFYQPFIDEYHDGECRYITRLSTLDFQSLRHLLTIEYPYRPDEISHIPEEEMRFARTSAKDISDLLDFYGWDQDSRRKFIAEKYAEGVSEEWNTRGLRGKARALKSAATGLAYGAFVLSNDEIAQSGKKMIQPFFYSIFLKDIASDRMNDPKYRDKRCRMVIDMLTNSYLDALHR